MPEYALLSADLLIIPCACQSYLGKLPVIAARALAVQAGICCFESGEDQDGTLLRQTLDNADRTIVVDGCEKRCMEKEMQQYDLVSEFHLTLTDLGIEEQSGPIRNHEENLLLAQDGIVAESTRASETFPRIPGCGCC